MDLISYLTSEYLKSQPMAEESDSADVPSREQQDAIISDFAAFARQKLIDNPPVLLGTGTDGLYELTLKDTTRVLVCEGLKPRAQQQRHRMDEGAVGVTGNI